MRASVTGILLALALVLVATNAVQAQPSPPATDEAVPVTADYFIRAESDSVFTGVVAQGGFGKFFHTRQLTPIDDHVVMRAEPRHALFGGRVRPRRRAGDDHAARTRASGSCRCR